MKRLISVLIGLFLVVASAAGLYFTWFILSSSMIDVAVGFDQPVIIPNYNLATDILCILFLFVILIFAAAFIGSKRVILTSNIVRLTAFVILAIMLFVYINVSDPQLIPEDSGVCYSAAQSIFQNNYSVIQSGSYVYHFPNMLGVISLNILFFSLFGAANTSAFYYFNAVCVLTMVWFGAAFIRMIICSRDFLGKEIDSDKDSDADKQIDPENKYFRCKVSLIAETLWMLFCLFDIPLNMLVLFRYGDIAQAASLIMAFYFAVRCIKSGKMRYCFPVIIVLSVGVLLRENTMVGCIALLLFYLVAGVKNGNLKRTLILTGTVLLVMILPIRIQRACYEKLAGERIVGTPVSAWIAMGMMENETEGPGWYNGYNWIVFEDYGGREGADVAAKAFINARTEQFMNDPGLMINFYHRKTVTQWADPLYEALGHTSFGNNAHPFFLNVFGKRGEEKPLNEHLYRITDLLQSIVFIGGNIFLVISAVLCLKKKEKYMGYMLLLVIAVTGGVLFSVLWEAKSRYTIGYLPVIMLMGAVGYSYAACRVSAIIRSRLPKSKLKVS